MRWYACVHRLDLMLHSHPKEFWWNGVRTHVNSKGNNPLPEAQRRDEPTTLHHAGQRAQHTTDRTIPAPNGNRPPSLQLSKRSLYPLGHRGDPPDAAAAPYESSHDPTAPSTSLANWPQEPQHKVSLSKRPQTLSISLLAKATGSPLLGVTRARRGKVVKTGQPAVCRAAQFGEKGQRVAGPSDR